VSALSHFLEDEGLATVNISLVRLHSEKVRNPRSLWVPFELGRPLGAPDDAAFQTRVILQALRMLENPHGPVLLEDFADEAPGAQPDPRWHAPFALMPSEASGVGALRTALHREIESVAPLYDRQRAVRGRTTVGVSGLPIAACVDLLADFLDGAPPASPVAEYPAVQVLRFAIDDVKAFYLEALPDGHSVPSSRQLADWFWSYTTVARVILRLRERLIASEDKRSVAIGRTSLVPRAQLERFGIV
jgi:hypothetical protein